METNHSEIDSIVNEFEQAINNYRIIPYDKIILWFSSNNVGTLGAVFSYITKDRYSSLILPPLTNTDLQKFFMRYFGKCFEENPSSEWTDTRYEAGWSVVNWFNNLWKNKSISRDLVLEIKNWLANQYKDGNEELRTCIITATLEHLFENSDISNYFSDWKEDPILKNAYDEAMTFAEKLKSKK